MRRITKEVAIEVCAFNELVQIEQEMFKRAIEARGNASEDYSKYMVGCAILVESGEIFTGVNVEFCSWTQTTHGEQTALCSAVTKLGPTRIRKVAVVGAPRGKEVALNPDSNPENRIQRVDQVCPSCGHCLQIIVEYCFNELGLYDPDIVLMGDCNGEFYRTTIGDALPMPFLPQYLGTNYAEIIAQRAQKRNRA